MQTSAPDKAGTSFNVPRALDFFGGLLTRHAGFFVKLGNFETKLIADKLDDVRIDRPVYVSGLARSGSTILLEFLAATPGVTTHQYKDFPPIFTPYLWNRYLQMVPGQQRKPVERTHLDGIQVTPDSPEAMEEVLWMTFFPHIHEPGVNHVLGADTTAPTYERFYQDHIRKLLLVRGGRRYVSKGNYLFTRAGYLARLFPDVKFVVPVRQPLAHIASLVKQHRLFCEGETQNPSMLDHMRRVGHFEFGLDRRPIDMGDDVAAQVQDLWDRGEETRGWARYWACLHRHLAALRKDPAVKVVKFEDLCANPSTVLREILQHAELPEDEDVLSVFAKRIRMPTYYKHDFSTSDVETIREETGEVASLFGYNAS